MKLIKPWSAVQPGDRYASTMPIGTDIPKELQAAAVEAGVAEYSKAKPNKFKARD